MPKTHASQSLIGLGPTHSHIKLDIELHSVGRGPLMLLSLSILRVVMRAVVSEASVGPRKIRPRACDILYTNAHPLEAFVLVKHERKTFKKTKHLEIQFAWGWFCSCHGASPYLHRSHVSHCSPLLRHRSSDVVEVKGPKPCPKPKRTATERGI